MTHEGTGAGSGGIPESQPGIVLRRARPDDMVFLLELRNDPKVRQSAFNAEPVDLDTHRAWFGRRLSDPDTVILIAEHEGTPVGQVRYDLDPTRGIAEVDIAVVPAMRARGLATTMLKAGARYLLDHHGVETCVAHIRAENVASRRAFEKAGYERSVGSACGRAGCVEMKRGGRV